MTKTFVLTLFGLTALLIAQLTMAETKVTGFASMYGGLVTNGEQFLADYPNTGLYDTDFSFAPETTFGVQLKTNPNDQIEFIIQLLSRGAHEFDTDIDWAYVNYSINSELSLQMGRKRLPLYYYSDFYELGFAYYWVRPPSDNYTWQITNYNGLSLIYEPDLEYWDASFNLYIGREDDKENNLLTFFADNTPVDESWKNMVGFVAEISDEFFEYRFTAMSSQLSRESNNIILSDGVNQVFYGLSVNARFDNHIILSEYNHYKRAADNIRVTTHMISYGYKLQKLTPHITYSELKQLNNINGADEHHYTTSIGLRYNLNASSALKVQYDKTIDDAINSTIVGNAELLTFGIDVVF